MFPSQKRHVLATECPAPVKGAGHSLFGQFSESITEHVLAGAENNGVIAVIFVLQAKLVRKLFKVGGQLITALLGFYTFNQRIGDVAAAGVQFQQLIAAGVKLLAQSLCLLGSLAQ